MGNSDCLKLSEKPNQAIILAKIHDKYKYGQLCLARLNSYFTKMKKNKTIYSQSVVSNQFWLYQTGLDWLLHTPFLVSLLIFFYLAP